MTSNATESKKIPLRMRHHRKIFASNLSQIHLIFWVSVTRWWINVTQSSSQRVTGWMAANGETETASLSLSVVLLLKWTTSNRTYCNSWLLKSKMYRLSDYFMSQQKNHWHFLIKGIFQEFHLTLYSIQIYKRILME